MEDLTHRSDEPPPRIDDPSPSRDEPALRGFRMTSARRRHDRPWLWTIAALAAIVVATAVLVRRGGETPEPSSPAPRARVVASSAPTAAATPTPSATPEPVFVELETELVLEPPPSPTPTPRLPEPTIPSASRSRRAEPEPRRLADCLSVSWTYGQASLRPPQVLIDIAARNGCGRDLAASEVWFRATGWRQGDLIQTASGHLFSTLYDGSIGYTGIGLPGSQDWYDQITLEVLEGAP